MTRFMQGRFPVNHPWGDAPGIAAGARKTQNEIFRVQVSPFFHPAAVLTLAARSSDSVAPPIGRIASALFRVTGIANYRFSSEKIVSRDKSCAIFIQWERLLAT